MKEKRRWVMARIWKEERHHALFYFLWFSVLFCPVFRALWVGRDKEEEAQMGRG